MALDPLTVKELSGIARRWQTYAGRTFYVALITFILWGFWATMIDGAVLRTDSEYTEFSRVLFFSFFALQMLVVSLAGITTASDQITKEVRAGTLGLLALTPLTPWAIAFGKWKAALVQAATALFCGAPVLAICVFLGGVGLRELAYSCSLSLATAALCAALGLLGSTLFRSGNVATIVSIVAIGGSGLLPILVMVGIGSRGAEEFMTLLCWTHPYYSAVGAAVAGFARGSEQEAWRNGWVGASFFSFVAAAILLRIAAARIAVLLQQSAGPTLLARTLETIDRATAKGKTPADPVWQSNAILWKELRTRPAGRFRNIVRIALGLFLLVLLPYGCIASENSLNWMTPLLWCSVILLLLISVSNGASLFVKEKEERKWDILLTTPLTALEIVRAKLLAGLSSLLPAALVLFLIWSLTAALHRVGALGWAMTILAVVLPCLLAYSVGALHSLKARSLQAAFSGAFSVMLGLLLVLPAVLGVSFTMMRPRLSGNTLEFLLSCINPVEVLATFSSVRSWRNGWSGGGNPYLQLLPQFMIFCSVYAGAIALLLARILLGFDRISGRSRQA